MSTVPVWSDRVVALLLDAQTCPACSASALVQGRCPRCGADASGPEGVAVWNASVAVAHALQQRAELVHALPRVPVGAVSPAVQAGDAPAQVTSPVGVPDAATPSAGRVRGAAPLVWGPGAVGASGDLPSAPPAPGRGVHTPVASEAERAARSSATLQSVLATAGAGLFAVAAIVFTYFNPDLADRTLRSVVIALVTLVFLGGAWMLSRRRLQFSAEAVGGLGLVFVGLDVHAMTQVFTTGASPWLTTALGTLLAGGLMLFAAVRVGVRVWLWASLLALVSVPMMVGFGVRVYEPTVMASLGLVASAFAAAGASEFIPSLSRAFGRRMTERAEAAGETEGRSSTLRGEVVSLTVLRLLIAVAGIATIVASGQRNAVVYLLWIACVLALLAGMALWSTRHLIRGVWSVLAGLWAAAALVLFAMSLVVDRGPVEYWLGAVAASGAALAVVGVAALPLMRTVQRTAMAVGVFVVACVALFMSVVFSLMAAQLLLWSFVRTVSGASMAWAPHIRPVELVWSPVAALGVMALAWGVFALVAPRRAKTRGGVTFAQSAAIVSGTLAVLTMATADLLPLVARVSIAVALGVVVGLLLWASPRREKPRQVALPLVPGAVGAGIPDAPPAAPVVGVEPTKAGRWGIPASPGSIRVPLLFAAHLAVIVSVLVAWLDRSLVPYAAVGTLVVVGVVAAGFRPSRRFVHVGFGYAYALVAVGTALSLAGFDGVPLLSLTVSVGLIGAIGATFLPRVNGRDWQAVLVVTTVPFLLGVSQVFFERSGWTALSTGLMFVLALSLLATRRPGLTAPVRVMAAGMLVPALAVTVLCLGAQFLAGSGSPVVLPIIGVIVAAVLPAGSLIRDGLVSFGRSAGVAEAARLTIEVSSLVTGAIAVVLAIVRPAAGLGTACLVLILIGLGATLTSLVADRRYTWWVAGIAFTGALWSVWGLAGVDLPEAYLLPPTLIAALVGLLMSGRGRRAVALYSTGLLGAVVPLVVFVLFSTSATNSSWRTYGLLIGAGLLGWAAIVAVRVDSAPRRALARPTALAAGVAATAATFQAMRWGTGFDNPPFGFVTAPLALLGLCLMLGVLAAGVWVLVAVVFASRDRGVPSSAPDAALPTFAGGATVPPAPPAASFVPGEAGPAASTAGPWMAPGATVTPGKGIRNLGSRKGLSYQRWRGVPAVLALMLSAWPAIARDAGVVGVMWSLMLAGLITMVVAAARPRTVLPPVWFLFGVSFVTGVVAWSPRDLRVEMFSLPMGLFLLLAGLIGLRAAGATAAETPTLSAPARPRHRRGRLYDWPQGSYGSWVLLAPGLIVMMSASIVATFTDPLTWRAILVMVLALGAILFGARGRLAAPFIIGLIVLPIENVFVFAVQLGRGIESMPWWITLAVIGAVLLIIAVAGERKEGSGGGVAARMRDLR